jgi:hypothetical protein
VAKIRARRPGEALRTTGINEFLRKVANDLDIELCDDDRFERRPDAWSYIPNDDPSTPGTFNLYEIEDSNKLSSEKLYDYAWIWFYLDDYEFEVNLFVYDRYGENEVQLCLCEYWFMFLQDDIDRDAAEKSEIEPEPAVKLQSYIPRTKAEKDAYFASLVAERKARIGW